MGERCQTSHSEPATTATATPMARTAMVMAIRMAQDTMAGMRGLQLPRLRTAMATHTARTMAVMAVMAQHIRGVAAATPMAAPMLDMEDMAMATPTVPAMVVDMATHMAGATMATTRFSRCLCVYS